MADADEYVVVGYVWDGALVGQVLSEADVDEGGAEVVVDVALAGGERRVAWVPQDEVGYS